MEFGIGSLPVKAVG